MDGGQAVYVACMKVTRNAYETLIGNIEAGVSDGNRAWICASDLSGSCKNQFHASFGTV